MKINKEQYGWIQNKLNNIDNRFFTIIKELEKINQHNKKDKEVNEMAYCKLKCKADGHPIEGCSFRDDISLKDIKLVRNLNCKKSPRDIMKSLKQ